MALSDADIQRIVDFGGLKQNAASARFGVTSPYTIGREVGNVGGRGVDPTNQNWLNSLNPADLQNFVAQNPTIVVPFSANTTGESNVFGFLQAPEAILAIATMIVAPYLAPAIGAELGLTGSAATAAGYGAIGASQGAVVTAANGGDASQIAESALKGGVGSAAGSAIGSAANAAVGDLGTTGAAALGGATKSGVQAGLSGGSVGANALGGAVGSGLGTEIGGDFGKILGGAAGSATGAAASGGNVGQSALIGGLTGAGSALSGALRQQVNPATGQVESVPDTQTPPTPETPPQPDVQPQLPFAGQLDEITISGSPDLTMPEIVSSTKDEAGNFLFPEITVSGQKDLELPEITVEGSPDIASDSTTQPTKDKTGSTKQGGVQLISPTIVPSASGGGSPQVLSSVLGAPSSTILGQALQSSNPDPSTTGSPILDGDGKNVRNVWNTESLRTALGL
jgi:hypothetical protein